MYETSAGARRPETKSPFELDIVFANWTEDIQYPAVRKGAPRMHRIGRNDADGPRPKHVADPVHDNFEFALEGVRDLFMRMGMFRQDGPGRNVPIDERHAGRSDEFSAPAWKWRLLRKVIEVCAGHCGAGLILARRIHDAR